MLRMNHKRPLARTVTLLFIVLLLLLSIPLATLAAGMGPSTEEEQESVDYIELDGTFTGTFDLSSNTSKLFHLENIAPGDEWSGTVHVKNSAPATMEIAVISVTSNIEDTVLFDRLVTKISVGEETAYDGAYGFQSEEESMTKFYPVAPGDTLDIDITVSLPRTVGNEIIDKVMDSTWTFEARYYGSSYLVRYVDEDGNDLAPSKTAYARIGDDVTENAIDIDGYTPKVNTQTIHIEEEDNVIIFVYTKDSTGGPAQTGSAPLDFALTVSAWLLIISAAAIVIIASRLRTQKRQKADN